MQRLRTQLVCYRDRPTLWPTRAEQLGFLLACHCEGFCPVRRRQQLQRNMQFICSRCWAAWELSCAFLRVFVFLFEWLGQINLLPTLVSGHRPTLSNAILGEQLGDGPWIAVVFRAKFFTVWGFSCISLQEHPCPNYNSIHVWEHAWPSMPKTMIASELESMRLPEHPCPNHNSIHVREHTITRPCMPKP